MSRLFKLSPPAMAAIAAALLPFAAQAQDLAPPERFALKLIGLNDRFGMWVDKGTLRWNMAGWTGFWILQVAPVGGETNTVWSYYRVDCDDWQIARSRGFVVNLENEVVDTFDSLEREMQPVAAGSMDETLANMACDIEEFTFNNMLATGIGHTRQYTRVEMMENFGRLPE